MDYLFLLILISSSYSYIIYPIILVVLSKIIIRNKNYDDLNNKLPYITLIITVHNEEKLIKRKILNSLEIEYPHDKKEIIVSSDCSNDRTEQIVKSMSDSSIKLIRTEQRKGKENAQWTALQKAKGSIIVFTDVATELGKDSFYIISEAFQDTCVGAVSSEDKFISKDGSVVGEGLYVRYEMYLRFLESNLAGLVGLSGSLFAVRKSICNEWDINIPSDFNTAINCKRNGYIAVSDKRLIGMYKDIDNDKQEFSRKKRTIIRGITSIYRNLDILNIFKYGMFSFQIWSHKVMRWLVPWFLLSLFICSIIQFNSSFLYALIVYLEVILISLNVLAHFYISIRSVKFINILYYFTISNLAIALACIEFSLGKRVTIWQPSER